MFEFDTKSCLSSAASARLRKKSLYHNGDRGERMKIRKNVENWDIKLRGVLDMGLKSAHDYTNRGASLEHFLLARNDAR